MLSNQTGSNVYSKHYIPSGLFQSNPKELNVYAKYRQECYRTQRIQMFIANILKILYDP